MPLSAPSVKPLGHNGQEAVHAAAAVQDDTRRLGLLLVVLRAHLVFAMALLALALLGAAFVLDFIELPGGLWDAAASKDSETHLRAIMLHVLYVASLAALLHAVRKQPQRRSAYAVAHAVLGVLTVPFGAVLGALAGWHKDGDWDAADRYAASVGGRTRIALWSAWAVVVLLSSALAFGAYLGILAGVAWAGLLSLVAAVAVQVAALRLLVAYEPRTKLRTYGSPMPDLPEWYGKHS